MEYACPTLKKTRTEDNVFDPRCASMVFKPYPRVFNNLNEEILNHINQINDPILKYISFYFVQYYIDGHDYYEFSKKPMRDAACQYLKRWLQEKKDLFTYGGMCIKKLALWESKFSTLWTIMGEQKEYITADGNELKPWCQYRELYTLTKFPDRVTSPNCEQKTSKEPYRDVPYPETITTGCECPGYEFSQISQISQIKGNAPDINPTKKIAVTSGLTSVGTAGALLLLYKYTPVLSWFRGRGRNNIRRNIYMNPGAADDFLMMQDGYAPYIPDHDSNDIFYHSSLE